MMLRWDEFDKELRDELAVYSSRRQSYKYCINEISLGDSEAIRRAKAALDALDTTERLAPEEFPGCKRGLFSYIEIQQRDIFSGKTVYQGSYSLYDFIADQSRKSCLSDFFSRVVSIFSAFQLSSVFSSLSTTALNAELRTPLFAYDAELSIDRHRLRSTF